MSAKVFIKVPMSNDRVHGESAIIERYLEPLARGFPGAFGLEDDCCVIAPSPGCELVVKTDPIAEGVHFFADDDAADIAWKALAVNVSDLAAKGAVPLAYLMALSFPDAPRAAWLERFARGLGEAQAAFAIHLAGGDTDRRPGPVTISITAFGEVPAAGMVRRATARPGDRLFMTGTLGDSALGLRMRLAPDAGSAWALSEDERQHLATRYLRPSPRLAIRRALRHAAHAAMDISDGLVKDASRMARASGVAITIEAARIPLSSAARAALSVDAALMETILTGGDDYEVLAAVPADRCAAFQAMALADGVTVSEIGHVGEGAGVIVNGDDGRAMVLARDGYDHF